MKFLISPNLANTSIVYPFYSSHLTGCEVVYYCGFDLHFPHDEQGWSFQVLTRQLYTLFGEMEGKAHAFFAKDKKTIELMNFSKTILENMPQLPSSIKTMKITANNFIMLCGQ